MEPNLTYPIILNATLNQPPQGPLSNPAITTLLGVVIGSIIAFFFTSIQENRRFRIANLQRQEQAYSQLTGLKYIIIQLYLSKGDALSLFAWAKARERLQLPSLPDVGKIEEINQKCDTLKLELARNNQRIWETIGLIRVLFYPSEELEKLIERFEPSIIKLRDLNESIAYYYERATIANVDVPPDDAIAGLDEAVLEYVVIPVDALLKYLEEKIKAEKTHAKSWWQFWR